MTFLALNGTTIPCLSPGADEDAEEYGLDRARMFDGTMRMTRRGLFRKWSVTTRLLTPTDARTILALINQGNNLTATGDLVESTDGVLVMPIPGKHTPVMSGAGLKRRLTFVLEEQPTPFVQDTTSNVFLFLRHSTNIFSDRAGTVVAVTGDPLGRWVDATGNGRYAVATADGNRPTIDGDEVRFGSGSTNTYLDLHPAVDFNLLATGEVMLSVRVVDDPPATVATGGLYWLGREGDEGTYYPKPDGHIYDGFGRGNGIGGASADIGNPTDDLRSRNVYGMSSDNTQSIARLNNIIIQTLSNLADGANFSAIEPRIGEVNGSNHLNGWIRDFAIFDGVLTDSQRLSWYRYMIGLDASPPI